jgi:hypothetical protein
LSNTLLTTGLACVIAAIIGGGLKAFGIEIGLLRSWKRQGLLAMFGAMLITAAYVIEHPAVPQPPPVEILLFDNKNNYNVSNSPPRLAEFAISKAHYVTSIWDYHWNQGQGATPGNISLQRSDGTIYGPWEVTAPDKASMQNWECRPRVAIPAGTYTIVDSDHATWSWNEQSKQMGMSKVRGYPLNER